MIKDFFSLAIAVLVLWASQAVADMVLSHDPADALLPESFNASR